MAEYKPLIIYELHNIEGTFLGIVVAKTPTKPADIINKGQLLLVQSGSRISNLVTEPDKYVLNRIAIRDALGILNDLVQSYQRGMDTLARKIIQVNADTTQALKSAETLREILLSAEIDAAKKGTAFME